ncbi:hypothetical protein [Psychromicrobium lacuslunae]|uniref:Uncharacterized protein n=1 Tax=Psychromicrobium lacuslunae TaxID=1618207 RepID=A0A0D4BW90_9MICC|nr:hypothetical protein [Psychromicrobium lacuslunae]AJT40727.1 hypothetical protein UM93_02920 [Psychromicrobium lacuslunae]
MSFHENGYYQQPGIAPSHSYGRSPGLVARAVIGALIAATIATVLALLFLPGISIPMRQNRQLILLLAFGAGSLVLLLILGSVLWRDQFKVVISGSEVTVIKAYRTIGHFDARMARVSSQVVKQSTNGIPSGTVRRLIISIQGLEQQFSCKQFSRKTFSELVAHLQSFALSEEAQQAAQQPSGHQQAAKQRLTFQLDPSVFSSRVTGLTILGVVGGVIALLAGVLIALFWGSESEDFFDLSIWLFLAVGIGIIFLLAGLLSAASLSRQRRRTPQQLGLDSQGLYVDQHYFAFSSLRRIQATPPNYGISQQQKLRLQQLDGGKAEFLLGLNHAKMIKIFPQYGEFIGALQQFTATQPGLLVMDLQ